MTPDSTFVPLSLLTRYKLSAPARFELTDYSGLVIPIGGVSREAPAEPGVEDRRDYRRLLIILVAYCARFTQKSEY